MVFKEEIHEIQSLEIIKLNFEKKVLESQIKNAHLFMFFREFFHKRKTILHIRNYPVFITDLMKKFAQFF